MYLYLKKLLLVNSGKSAHRSDVGTKVYPDSFHYQIDRSWKKKITSDIDINKCEKEVSDALSVNSKIHVFNDSDIKFKYHTEAQYFILGYSIHSYLTIS